MGSSIEALRERLSELAHLRAAAAVLDWDQQTFMPPAAVNARSEQKAVLARMCHRIFVDDATSRLLDAATAEGIAPGSQDADLIRVARRDLDRARRIPEALVVELTRTTSLAQEAWAKARAANDYQGFAPWLQRLLDLTRQVAEALGYQETAYDALLDQYELGMTTRELDRLFADFRTALPPLVQAIQDRSDRVDGSFLYATYPARDQQEYGEWLLGQLGYDFSRGRQDRAVHPFCTHFSRDDVRITTRYDEGYLPQSIFGTLHEMGHAHYELGTDPALEGSILGSGTSLGVHESQSRTWENLVGRSRPFWKRFFPRLRDTFPGPLGSVGAEAFYRAINRVMPSLIRVEADEVTYNLHILLRYDLERDLLSEKLSVADAPDAWNAGMESYLGLTPPSNAEGVLQDVHWSIGIFGYFPTYSLGNLLSVQIYEAALAAEPGLAAQLDTGEYAGLLAWLQENVYRHGRRLDPQDLVRQVTGRPMETAPYLAYLHRKFGEIYELPTRTTSP